MAPTQPMDGIENTVDSLMRRNFLSVAPTESLLEADRLMRLARIRHLPVVERGRLVGLLSHRDVLEAAIPKFRLGGPDDRASHLAAIGVSEIMRPNPYTADPKMTLADAARRMLRLRIGCLPVVHPRSDGEELIGLVTESDLLRAAYAPDFYETSDS